MLRHMFAVIIFGLTFSFFASSHAQTKNCTKQNCSTETGITNKGTEKPLEFRLSCKR